MPRRRTHRAEKNRKPPQPVLDCALNVSAPQAPTLAGVLKAEEPDIESAPVAPRQAEKPLLKAWPPGYEKGAFRLVPGGVLLSAEGMPVLVLKEAEKIAAPCVYHPAMGECDHD
ncbi:MAG: hypothetical protein WBX25_34290 [Rhodomicrobium sp.]